MPLRSRSFQSTVKKQLSFTGYGIHSGKWSQIVIHPAPINHGIIFLRKDLEKKEHFLSANFTNGEPSDLCTILKCGKFYVRTIEHLMAAVSAFALDNLLVEISSTELPILDGGAATYVQNFAKAGIKKQTVPRKYLRVLKQVRVESGSSFAEFSPSETTRFDISIAFDSTIIGKQQLVFTLNKEYFIRELAPARTFGFMKNVEALWAAGLALGSSLENSVVLDCNGFVLNKSGLFANNEFVRHKALDAVGDTALLGYPFLGLFRSFRGGHRLNFIAVKALSETPHAYEIVESFYLPERLKKSYVDINNT